MSSKPLYSPISVDELEREMRAILEQQIAVMRNKSHDYAAHDLKISGDTLANVGDGLGWAGAWVRANDKMKRLKTALTTGKLRCEGIEDAFLDLINYAFYGLILYRRRNFDVTILFKDVEISNGDRD